MTAPDYWVPPPIWAGQGAHVIASGPGATQAVIDGLRRRNVIVVNSTVFSASWAPVWFFQDSAVPFLNRSGVPRVSRDGLNVPEFVKAFAGLAVTSNRRVKELLPCVRLVKAPSMNRFPAPGSPEIRSGRCSGQTAISLAVALGATRIALHGFDMRFVEGREHHHREYEGRLRNVTVYDQKFLPAFAGWHAQALQAGVSIVNATPGSALREFPMAS